MYIINNIPIRNSLKIKVVVHHESALSAFLFVLVLEEGLKDKKDPL